jgi:zinc and cadmium transporter
MERMLSLSAGVMLSTSLLHVLPDAFAARDDPQGLFATLLAGLLTFFVFEKLVLIRQECRNKKAAPVTSVGRTHVVSGNSAWMVMAGDALHTFTDGIMIAAAFVTNPGLGLLTGLAIIIHELPQTVSDFAVLQDAGYSRLRAYAVSLVCSLMSLPGAIFGYVMLGHAQATVPYVLTFASAGFIYIAVSRLMPRLQRIHASNETAAQLALLAAGIGVSLVFH